MIESLALLAAVFSAVATAFAAFATWRAPITAAKLAETLRRDGERNDERRRQKLNIFSTLMQERAQIYSENAVRALNLIDVVFNESREVREAWSELFLAFQLKPYLQHVVDERLRKLLAEVANDIGLFDKLRTDDLGRVYYPIVLQQQQFIEYMQRQEILARLQSGNAAGASAPSEQNTLWPPRPV
jgi:hypothetical protein